MTALSGYSSSLPTDVILGSLVLAIDSTSYYGVTQGEPTVNIPREFQMLPYDGSLGIPMQGLERKMWSEVYIEGTFVELNATKLLDLEPGGSTATSGGITTVTPGTYGEFLAANQYKENVRMVMRRGGGGVVLVEFNYARITVQSITGSGPGNGTISLRIDAVQVAGAAPGDPPYSLKLAADLATIQAADP